VENNGGLIEMTNPKDFVEQRRKEIVETHPAIKIPYNQFKNLPIREQEKILEMIK